MPESQNIEYKSAWRDEYLKWVCGFANSNGGKLYIGIGDNGEVVGIDNYQELLEQLPNKFRDVLGVYAEVNLLKENDKPYVEIIVPRYDVPISFRSKYYIRTGTTLQELKGPSLNQFILKRAGKTWDDVIEGRATYSDIDLKAIEAFKKGALKSKRLPFIENEDDIEKILDNLLLLERGQLKRSAILLFGKNPCRFYVNAFIKIGRFGKTDDDLKFQEVVECNAFELADKTLDMLDKKFLISPISYEGLHRVENWEYPYKAVRETIINAVLCENLHKISYVN